MRIPSLLLHYNIFLTCEYRDLENCYLRENEGLMLKMKLQYFGHRMRRTDSLGKIPMLGKNEGRRRRRRQDETVGWHQQLNGHESEQTSRDSEGQRSLA